MTKLGGDELMIVFTTSNIGEAHIVAGRLNTEGIPTALSQESVGGTLGISVGILGRIHLLVRQVDYEKALSLLDPVYVSLRANNEQIIFEDEDIEE